MKYKAYTILLLLGLLPLISSFDHPVKLTASLIEYDSGTKSLRMECRVFIDDFEDVIFDNQGQKITVDNLSSADKDAIEAFFRKYYIIDVNGKKLPLEFHTSEVNRTYNTLTIKFQKQHFPIKKGDTFSITNQLMFEAFGYRQLNRITLHLSPLLREYNYQTTVYDDSFSFSI